MAAGLAAHLAYQLDRRAAVHTHVVDRQDAIARMYASLLRGRAFDRRDHGHVLVAEIHFDADATEVTFSVALENRIVLSRHVRRVRVELGDHALDGAFQQPLAVYGVDVLVLNPNQYPPELLDHAVRALPLAPGVGQMAQQHPKKNCKNQGQAAPNSRKGARFTGHCWARYTRGAALPWFW